MNNTIIVREYGKLIKQIERNIEAFNESIYPKIETITELDATQWSIRVVDFYKNQLFIFIVDSETLTVIKQEYP